jgi:hypothetical protein
MSRYNQALLMQHFTAIIFKTPFSTAEITGFIRSRNESGIPRSSLKTGIKFRCRMAFSRMLLRVALVRTDVSEELSASIIRVTRIGELGTLAVTSNRRTLRTKEVVYHWARLVFGRYWVGSSARLLAELTDIFVVFLSLRTISNGSALKSGLEN